MRGLDGNWGSQWHEMSTNESMSVGRLHDQDSTTNKFLILHFIVI